MLTRVHVQIQRQYKRWVQESSLKVRHKVLISNYAINATPEQALRANRAILPARVIAALDPMTKIVALILILGAMSGADAYGCSCKADTRALAEIVRSNISESDYVGVYEVDKTVSGNRKFAQVELKGRWVRLILVESIKGAPLEAFARAPGIFIRSNCDVQLTTGELLLVYGRDSEPVRLTLCSASGKIKIRLPELRVIFELQKTGEHP